MLLSGKPEPVIVTREDPEVPAATPALYDILELLRVTEALVKDAALTCVVKDKDSTKAVRETAKIEAGVEDFIQGATF